MIRDFDAKSKFDDDLARREGRLDHSQALDIFTRLWEEGRELRVLPPADPMEGIKTDIAVARILNSCSRN
ncbi:MAG: hypothetical protein RRA32_04535 [bacterium]|nr:hypothetical protein [bacterium]